LATSGWFRFGTVNSLQAAVKTVMPIATADINLTVVLKIIQDLAETGRKSGVGQLLTAHSTTGFLF
jgi:hypothetical protein